MSNQYAAQLSDPHWKELRDRIVSRDGGRCVQCGSTDELNVHHSHYREGRAPWEYRDSDLFTLCGAHHRKVHGIPEVREILIRLPKDDSPVIQAMREEIERREEDVIEREAKDAKNRKEMDHADHR